VQVAAVLADAAVEKVPAGHATGGVPAGQYQPAGHGVESAIAPRAPLTPVGQKLPALHAVHAAAPGPLL